MQWTGLNELREKYLSFFEGKGHLRLDSFPLVPKDDPSLLLINSGMAPMKKWFLAQEEPPRHRVTTCQKCIRTPDIERVGITARHGTFFEMLGNFSFQDYFKEEVIPWAWEFLTSDEWMAIPKDKLHISVYEEDDEAYDIWTKKVGIAPDHMVRLGKEDNFWEHGSGPCGPCSEIYFDRGPEYGCGKPTCGVGCDCDRYMEIWNLVFSQFDADGKGHYERLARPNIDTGMGLERLACVMQGVGNLFEVDTVQSVLHHVEHIAGKTYGANAKDDISIRVITDHIRSCTFMVSDGILPSNEGRGYVLRRLLRRAARHGRMLGICRPFLVELVETVIQSSESAYPELREHDAYIKKVIGTEEANFARTIDAGMTILNNMIDGLEKAHEHLLKGLDVFKLNDTFGFPLDLTKEIAAEQGIDIDEEGFHTEMKKQKERARAERLKKNISGWSEDLFGSLNTEPTVFTGYETLNDTGVVVALSDEETLTDAIATDEQAKEDVLVVLDKTPFYAEMGGQQGDAGELSAEGVALTVSDTKNHNGLYAHVAYVAEGTLTVGASVIATLDAERRGFLRRNHTATHLLDAALKHVLGEHVSQAGSLVTPEHLRFDFTHFEALSSEQLKAVEDLVNQQIFASKPVVTCVMGIDEAKAAGAVALFGEKYGDVVRVVSVGAEDQPFSREFCGGTHAANTAEIGLFKIISESSTGSNVRRIEAVTSKGALDYMADRLALVDAAAAALKCRVDEVPARVENLQAELRETSNKLKKALTGGSSDAITNAIEGAVELDGYKLVVAELQGLEAADLRNVWDTVHQKVAGPVACVVASVTEKGTPALLAAGSDDAVKAGFHAGNVIKQIAGLVDGRGGGRPNMAQAGGKNAAGIADALAAAKTALGA